MGLAPPASSEAIEADSAAVGSPLPGSLVSFLRIHDGIHLLLTPENAIVAQTVHFPSLDFYETDLIADSKDAVSKMFGGVNFDDLFSNSATEEKAYRCVPLASISLYHSRQQIVFVPDTSRANGEYAIVEADIDERQLWLNALDDDVEITTTATSFDEFLRRTICNVLGGRRLPLLEP